MTTSATSPSKPTSLTTAARIVSWIAQLTAAVIQSLVVACVGLGLVPAGVATSSAGDPAAGAVLMPSATDGHGHEIAILAGGCFWGMEQLIRELEGVVDTEVGYSGGSTTDATYDKVKRENTGHAESVRVVFDPDTLSYEELLRFFFRIHDPTNRNRQGNDVGSSYRSAIFVMNDSQRRVAEKVVADIDASGFWKRPIVTEITDAGPFIVAEDYHQDYLVKHPDGYTCHYDRGTIRVSGKKK
jgi:methionine-S-sulfoxide reductase